MRAGPPPLARGPPLGTAMAFQYLRTTPARAGTTRRRRPGRRRGADHPRSRGDHAPVWAWPVTDIGPPPLARGPHEGAEGQDGGDRTTPARAGTTARTWTATPIRPDHPRSRGDHERGYGLLLEGVGPPPLARGPPRHQAPGVPGPRTTPARAGTTRTPAPAVRTSADHPRSRGDHASRPRVSRVERGPPPLAWGPLPEVEDRSRVIGPPPLAWGPRRRQHASGQRLRTTPARVGTTLPELGV